MFYGKTFIFDEMPSEFYNLCLGSMDDTGVYSGASGSEVLPLTQKLFRRPVPLFWGTEQTPVLQFPISVYSTAEITMEDYSQISAWLFGQQTYKKLRICQCDMTDVYFNCFLTAPTVYKVGNIIRGFTATVMCDAPWGWKEDKVYTYTYTPTAINDTVYVLNQTANVFYTYPTSLALVASSTGGALYITNVTDNNRSTQIVSLAANEIMTLNCDLQTITSNVQLYPLSSFNKNWLRLVRGWNTLAFEGNIASLSITFPVAVKVGG
jgi:phage-related protein